MWLASKGSCPAGAGVHGSGGEARRAGVSGVRPVRLPGAGRGSDRAAGVAEQQRSTGPLLLQGPF